MGNSVIENLQPQINRSAAIKIEAVSRGETARSTMEKIVYFGRSAVWIEAFMSRSKRVVKAHGK